MDIKKNHICITQCVIFEHLFYYSSILTSFNASVLRSGGYSKFYCNLFPKTPLETFLCKSSFVVVVKVILLLHPLISLTNCNIRWKWYLISQGIWCPGFRVSGMWPPSPLCGCVPRHSKLRHWFWNITYTTLATGCSIAQETISSPNWCGDLKSP